MQKTPDITQAAAILKSGGLVSFPTETVYGLGADAANENALRKIFAAKERPFDHPLIVHFAEFSQLSDWAREVPPAAKKLAEHFWPGPLTMVLKKQPHVSGILTGNQDTIGLRIPSHPIALALLKAFGGGIAAPSANKFTRISPTTAAAVREELGCKVDLVLDGGPCDVGLESTIINLSGDVPSILRPGMISADDIADILQTKVITRQSETLDVRAPGSHHLHYAPRTKTVRMETADLLQYLQQSSFSNKMVAVLGYSELILPALQNIHMVKLPAEPHGYAHELYQALRMLDNQQYQLIIIESVPMTPAWNAIADRLSKAAPSDS